MPAVAGRIDPPWLAYARTLKQVKETPGPKSNPIIIGWAKKFGGWIASFYKSDATPWCGLGMAHCLQSCGLPTPKGLLGAINYYDEEWGQKRLMKNRPAYGCLAVFKRPGGGHVGIYIGEDDVSICVYGFNQGDAVGYTWIAKTRLYGYVWPALGGDPPKDRVVKLTRTGALSTNEA